MRAELDVAFCGSGFVSRVFREHAEVQGIDLERVYLLYLLFNEGYSLAQPDLMCFHRAR